MLRLYPSTSRVFYKRTFGLGSQIISLRLLGLIHHNWQRRRKCRIVETLIYPTPNDLQVSPYLLIYTKYAKERISNRKHFSSTSHAPACNVFIFRDGLDILGRTSLIMSNPYAESPKIKSDACSLRKAQKTTVMEDLQYMGLCTSSIWLDHSSLELCNETSVVNLTQPRKSDVLTTTLLDQFTFKCNVMIPQHSNHSTVIARSKQYEIIAITALMFEIRLSQVTVAMDGPYH